MKLTRYYVRGSKPEISTCKHCGAALAPLKLYWHGLSCSSVDSNLNSTFSELKNKEETADLNGKSMEVEGSIRGVISSKVLHLKGVERHSNVASVNDDVLLESKPLPCKVEEDGESNPLPHEITAENGDNDAVLRDFQSPVSDEPSMTDCNVDEVISCLRDAFQRRDFESAAAALRYREEKLRRSGEVMAMELQARKRDLDELRKREGKKLAEVQKKLEEALLREMECHTQCEALMERYEDLTEMYRQTKEKLDDCERRCEALLRGEQAAQEKLVGLREICGEAFNGEREARKKVAEFERKCREQTACEDELEKIKKLKSCMEGVSDGVGDRNVQRVEAGEGKFIQNMECTPCRDVCTAKSMADGMEWPYERGDRVRKALFRSAGELGHDSRLLSPPNCDRSSSRVMDSEGCRWAPCTPDGKCRVNVGVGLKSANVSNLWSIGVPEKVEGSFSSLSPRIAADNPSHPVEGICKNGVSGNSIAKQLAPKLVMMVERVSDEARGKATSGETNRMEVAGTEEKAEQVANGVDIIRVEKNPYAEWIEEESHENSAVVPNAKTASLTDKHSRDCLTANECCRSEVKNSAQRSTGSVKHVSIVISDSDSDSESRGVSLRQKSGTSPCSMKAHSIPTTQRAETGSQNRVSLAGSNPVDGDSDHSKEIFIQRTAKCKRGWQNAVMSDSDSNISEAAFSCKRRKAKPSSLETETAHTSECGKLDKHDLLNSIGPCNLNESYHEAPEEGKAPKEGEVLNANREPYGCTGTDGNLREEDWGENEEGECAPNVRFRRLRRVKEVNEHDSREWCNKYACSIEEGECLPAIKFRRLRRVKENELHNSEKTRKSAWSIEEGEHVDVLKNRKFQGVDEGNNLHAEEQCKDSKVATVSEEQNISYPDLNVMHSDGGIHTSDSRHFKDVRLLGFANHEKSAASIQFSEMPPGPIARLSHILATSNGKERDPSNCKEKTGEFRKGKKEIFIQESENTEVERRGRCPSRSNLQGNKLDQYTLGNSNDKLKAINLLKESDGEDEEDEVGSDSEGENLGGFIVDEVDESESGTDAEDLNGSKHATSDTLDLNESGQNLDSDRVSSSSSSEMMLDQILRKLSRRSANMPKWQYEADMLAAFAKDPVLCMRAICALYRQQTNEEQFGKSSLHVNGRGFDSLHAFRGSLLADFLTNGNPFGPVKKSLEELEKHDSKGVQFCRNLAFHHSKQLFEIYQNQEDPHFPSA